MQTLYNMSATRCSSVIHTKRIFEIHARLKFEFEFQVCPLKLQSLMKVHGVHHVEHKQEAWEKISFEAGVPL